VHDGGLERSIETKPLGRAFNGAKKRAMRRKETTAA
jgi:hypothetical protein